MGTNSKKSNTGVQRAAALVRIAAALCGSRRGGKGRNVPVQMLAPQRPRSAAPISPSLLLLLLLLSGTDVADGGRYCR